MTSLGDWASAIKVVVDPYCPPNTIYAVCEAGLPTDVEVRLALMPEGPERDRERFVELASRGHIVVGRNAKL